MGEMQDKGRAAQKRIVKGKEDEPGEDRHARNQLRKQRRKAAKALAKVELISGA